MKNNMKTIKLQIKFINIVNNLVYILLIKMFFNYLFDLSCFKYLMDELTDDK